ncbi:hypothetical protein V1478_003372 [Vespula squamosa]|uniref:Uncharacterized protein n=1 Tax=Vespula squamosa TaxID=30214 RepID=A0ABD2BLL5_VESSQ
MLIYLKPLDTKFCNDIRLSLKTLNSTNNSIIGNIKVTMTLQLGDILAFKKKLVNAISKKETMCAKLVSPSSAQGRKIV